ncbi:chemotaxis-specific protein-glutamate methyltransferase CheB [Persephonella sp.]
MGRKKVLVVDDSLFVRKILSRIISRMGYQVDTASDGIEAVKKILSSDYDLITLDIEMPGKNGIQVLKEVMGKKPSRIVIISSYTTENAELTLEALSLGAVSYITKPGKLGADISKIETQIQEKIKEVIELPLNKLFPLRKAKLQPEHYSYRPDSKKYILIGASTGGPKHIEQIISSLPENYPHSIAVVQHMPAGFTQKFAERLNKAGRLKVVEAETGEVLEGGKVIIAKGGLHLHFDRVNGLYVCKLVKDTKNSLFVPSVDEMFISAVNVLPPEQTVAVLLTGLGSDGAYGMLKLKEAGAKTLAESEETAVVYGMPREAFQIGAVDKTVPLQDIINYLQKLGVYNNV